MSKFKFFLYHLIGYFIILSIVVLFSNYVFENSWASFGIGCFSFIISIVLFFLLTKSKNINYIASIILSCIANGLFISSICIATEIYIYEDFEVVLLNLFSYILIATLIFVFFRILLKINFLKKHFVASLIIYIIITLGTLIILSIELKSPYFFILVIYSIVSWIFLIGYLKRANDEEDMYRFMAISTLSAVLIILVIALLIITESDADVGGDLDLDLDVDLIDTPISSNKSKKRDPQL